MNKKKIITTVIAVICILAIAVGIGVKKHRDYMKPVDYNIQSIGMTQMTYNKDIKIIAHRGYRAVAPENTVPAYEMAGAAGYWGAECDIYRTKDGIWVLMHDEKINRMMNGRGKVEEMTYEELKKLTVDNGCGIDKYPDLKIATLDEYLKICTDFGMNATIELKGSNNTEHYDEIINAVKKSKAEVTYISFGEDNLKAMRKLDEDAPMFLLVHKIDGKAIEAAKGIGNCGISFNASKKSNLKKDGAAIKKVTSAGLPVAAWTVDDIELMQQLVDYGVLYITTNCITY